MKVWLAMTVTPYEGDGHLGIFPTKAQAIARCKEKYDKEKTERLEWDTDADIPEFTWDDVHNNNEGNSITYTYLEIEEWDMPEPTT